MAPNAALIGSAEGTLCIARDTEGVGRVNIRSMPGKYSKLSEGTMRYA